MSKQTTNDNIKRTIVMNGIKIITSSKSIPKLLAKSCNTHQGIIRIGRFIQTQNGIGITNTIIIPNIIQSTSSMTTANQLKKPDIPAKRKISIGKRPVRTNAIPQINSANNRPIICNRKQNIKERLHDMIRQKKIIGIMHKNMNHQPLF
jgi:hypothetical protein